MATVDSTTTPPATHAVGASVKFAAFKKEMVAHATRTIAQRAAWQREREHATAYFRAEEAQSEGT